MTTESLQDQWHDFTQETSMHGLKYVKIKKIALVRRIVWAILILVMLGYLCWAGYLLLDVYFKKTVKTKVKVRNASNLTFPTVTICNRNYWKQSAAEGPNATAEIKETMRNILKDLYYPSSQSPPPDGKYNWSSPFLASWDKAGQNATGALEVMAHTLKETFIFCLVNGVTTPCDKIFKQVKTDAGLCYQFNQDGSFVSHTAGLSGGIQIFLDALTHEYYVGPFSYSEGFSVVVHEADVEPLVAELSYGIKTGTHTNMIVQRKETRRQPPPADDNQADCFDSENLPNPLHYYSTYSYSACYYECQISYVLNQCGCVDFLHPPYKGAGTCGVKGMLYCVTPAKREFASNPVYLEKCACKSTCNETQYSAKISGYTFPSENFRKDFEDMLNVSVDYMRRNYAAVDISYGQMSYELLEESFAYSFADIVASLGGTFGVSLGASILTMFEFVEFVTLSVARLIVQLADKSSKSTPIKPFKNSVSADSNDHSLQETWRQENQSDNKWQDSTMKGWAIG